MSDMQIDEGSPPPCVMDTYEAINKIDPICSHSFRPISVRIQAFRHSDRYFFRTGLMVFRSFCLVFSNPLM